MCYSIKYFIKKILNFYIRKLFLADIGNVPK